MSMLLRNREDLEHMLIDCPAHEHIRSKRFSAEYLRSLPPCVRLHGIMPTDFRTPPDFSDRDELMVALQRTLLEVFEHRQALAGVPVPPHMSHLPATVPRKETAANTENAKTCILATVFEL